MSTGPEPGWYHAEGDPPGTHRFWDGEMWQGEPQPVAPAVAPYAGSPLHASGRLQPGQSLGRAWPRVFARIIDGIIIAIPTIIILLSQVDFDEVADTGELGGGVGGIGSLLLVVALGAAYEIGFISTLGATPGKLMMGLRVVQENNNQTPPALTHAALRWLPALVTFVPAVGSLLGLVVVVGSLVSMSSDSLKRSVYDFAGGTYVISK